MISQTSPRVLVAGVGNIFLGDDGFGSEVLRALEAGADDAHVAPCDIRYVDYGIRGTHLAYDLLDGVDALVLVDAVPASGHGDNARPGSVRVMQVRPEDLDGGGDLDPHGMDPLAVLNQLCALGGTLPLTYVVGCVPAVVDEGIGLSGAVSAAVPEALDAVRMLLTEHIPEGCRR